MFVLSSQQNLITKPGHPYEIELISLVAFYWMDIRVRANFVGRLAGMSVEGFLNFLQKYDTMFKTELKERGFHN